MSSYRFMSRRAFLGAQIAAGGLTLLRPSKSYTLTLSASAPSWARLARIAPSPLWEDPTDAEMLTIINKLKAQKVSVVEADSILSYWLTEAQFDAHMVYAARFNTLVHNAGMKVVWYYPALEVISQGGQTGPSMYKTNPTWVQISLDGHPNVFYGSNVVFWVEKGEESAWMSPNGPYRDYFLGRIKKLAATMPDAIWPDVPIYFDGVHSWNDTSLWANAAAVTDGVNVPSVEDWTSPVWRRWIEWRHRNLNRYLLAIRDAARLGNPDIYVLIETVTCDYKDATGIGLDGAYLRKAEGISHVWEVDVVSLNSAMRNARENDWICLISMYKYGRAASGAKPAWAFSYGKQADDASLVMAEALAAGCNPFEVKTPNMEATVNAAMRTRMYSFVAAHENRLFNAAPLAKVVVYHSSACRDYIDGPNPGTGLYCTKSGASGWWSSDLDDCTTSQQWLAEYRGTIKALIGAHIPFEVLTSPTFEPADLLPYKVLMLPDCEAMSAAEANAIKDFVQNGGVIVITGPKPAGLNEFGDTVSPALAGVIGPSGSDTAYGLGNAIYYSDLPGKTYLKSTTADAFNRITAPILKYAPPVVTTTAPRQIHIEARTLGNETILQFVNFTGITGTFTVPAKTFATTVNLIPGSTVKKVEVTSADNATPALQPLTFTQSGAKVTFNLTLKQYSMVVITI
jgi:hypothetical protein